MRIYRAGWAFAVAWILAIVTPLNTITTAQSPVVSLPGIGGSATLHSIKVTLLDAKPLSLDEYREASGNLSPAWAGGGFRFAFLAENRAGAPMGPALGEIRVFVGSRPYNLVTNPTSRDAFAPDVVILSNSDFFSTSYGRSLRQRGPTPRSSVNSHVLDVFVRGPAVPTASDVVVELEQGETHRPEENGQFRQLSAAEMGASWMWFRFAALPRAAN